MVRDLSRNYAEREQKKHIALDAWARRRPCPLREAKPRHHAKHHGLATEYVRVRFCYNLSSSGRVAITDASVRNERSSLSAPKVRFPHAEVVELEWMPCSVIVCRVRSVSICSI